MQRTIQLAAIAAALMSSTSTFAAANLAFRYSGVPETDWMAPYTTAYTVLVMGGGGGDTYNNLGVRTSGGGGAYATATFWLTAGTMLSFGIGGRGADTGYYGGAGGGAGTTFFTTGRVLQLVAGGGGGAGYAQNGASGSITLAGTTTGDARPGTGISGAGGEAGHTTEYFGTSGGGGGGAGVFGAGGSSPTSSGGIGGAGTAGGNIYRGPGYLGGAGGSGGIAGGSGSITNGSASAGGGGGGFNGGAGGDNFVEFNVPPFGTVYGRGGGSYNRLDGTAGIGTDANYGNGFAFVSFDYTPPPPPPPPPPPVGGVPEPASWSMLIAGFGLVGAVQRRRTRREGVA